MNPAFFQSNRHKLVQALGGGLVVLFGYGRQQRSNDAAHPFSQEANFWYVTGIDEPDWGVIIDGTSGKTQLIMPNISETHRVFDGGLTAEEACKMSGVTSAVSYDEASSLLKTLKKRHAVIYSVGTPQHADYFNFSLNPSIAKHWAWLERHADRVTDIRKEIASLRAIKSREEIVSIRTAVDTTIQAFERVHKIMATYHNEYEIEADFTYAFRSNGASGHAYDPIIAAGKNACTLHYSHNSSRLTSRQLVLMDVGAQQGGYAADITRTYSRGEPTKRQKAVHAAVEEAHHQIIALLQPQLSVEQYHADVMAIMARALGQLGLDDSETGLRRYFPHAISHGLGIDVHDSLGAPRFFQEGMVLTVEPGIYIPEESIGVRIEDNIHLTATGADNLSAALSTGL